MVAVMAELGFDDNVDESRIYSSWERASVFLGLLKKVMEGDLCSDEPITDEERETYRLLTLYVGRLLANMALYPTKMPFSLMSIKSSPTFSIRGSSRSSCLLFKHYVHTLRQSCKVLECLLLAHA